MGSLGACTTEAGLGEDEAQRGSSEERGKEAGNKSDGGACIMS